MPAALLHNVPIAGPLCSHNTQSFHRQLLKTPLLRTSLQVLPSAVVDHGAHVSERLHSLVGCFRAAASHSFVLAMSASIMRNPSCLRPAHVDRPLGAQVYCVQPAGDAWIKGPMCVDLDASIRKPLLSGRQVNDRSQRFSAAAPAWIFRLLSEGLHRAGRTRGSASQPLGLRSAAACNFWTTPLPSKVLTGFGLSVSQLTWSTCLRVTVRPIVLFQARIDRRSLPAASTATGKLTFSTPLPDSCHH